MTLIMMTGKEIYDYKPEAVVEQQLGKTKYLTMNVGREEAAALEASSEPSLKPSSEPNGADGANEPAERWQCYSVTARNCGSVEEAVDALDKAGALADVTAEEAVAIGGHFGEDVANAVAVAKAAVEAYYNSAVVSSFTYQGVSMWTDFEHRQKLRMRLEAEEASGLTQTVIWYAGHRFELPISVTKQLLSQVELYSAKVFDVKNQHLVALAALGTVEEVLEYDWRQGWPEKLAF